MSRFTVAVLAQLHDTRDEIPPPRPASPILSDPLNSASVTCQKEGFRSYHAWKIPVTLVTPDDESVRQAGKGTGAHLSTKTLIQAPTHTLWANSPSDRYHPSTVGKNCILLTTGHRSSFGMLAELATRTKTAALGLATSLPLLVPPVLAPETLLPALVSSSRQGIAHTAMPPCHRKVRPACKSRNGGGQHGREG